MKVFKIRDKKTGLFSTGGMRPKFTKQGKVWQKLGYVHSHIQQLKDEYTPADVYKNAEVVEAEITESLTHVEDAKEWLIKTYESELDRFSYYKDRDWAKDYIARYKERKQILEDG